MAEIVIGRSENDAKKYGTEGTIWIGKQYIKMGDTMSLANKVLMDVVRPHVILVTGKRGEGKCLDGETPIILEDGSIKSIKDIAEDQNRILSLNQNLKITKNEKTKFYTREVEKLLKIRLRTGKKIKLTPEHPLLTINGWESACDLKEGSRIATPRIINAFGNESLREEEIKLLAYLITEGHLGNNFVLFSNTDPKIIEDFKESVRLFDNNLVVKKHGDYSFRVIGFEERKVTLDKRDKNGKFAKGVTFDSKSSIRKWLDSLKLYNKLSIEKEIPDCIFKAPKHQIALFMNRLFSCDGTIYPIEDTWQLGYSTSSKELAHQVQHLLLRFGIISVIKHRITPRHDNYELIIRGESAIRFIQEIGFFGQKESRQEKALKELSEKIRNPNLDTIPKELWDWYRPNNWAAIGKEISYKSGKALRSSINYSPSRQKLLQIAIADNNETIRQLAESDIYWDEIIEIEELHGKFTVYDISVPEFHNFVAADIIVHNSYTMAQMAEGIVDLPKSIAQNIAMLFLDTMGIFWTMKYPNYREESLLASWHIEPKGLENVKIFVPGGKFDELRDAGIPVDEKFYLTTYELSALDWSLTFGISPTESLGILISRVITRLTRRCGPYDIDNIIEEIRKDDEADKDTKSAVIARFEEAQEWGLFAREGTKIEDILVGGVASILDISIYTHIYGAFSIRALVIALFCKKILEQRETARKLEEKEDIEQGFAYFSEREVKKKRVPMVWMFIDEIHEFLPQEGETLATGPLLQIIREGRQPGISMIAATQQPGKMNTDVLSQCDMVVAHRVTSKMDIDALNTIMQTYMTATLTKMLDEMPRVKGCALILDQNQERVYSIQMRPRFSWHGGETPTAIPPKIKPI
jgi:hypothetical protein